MATERGTTFGYGDLVADLRSLVIMRDFAPVCLDATHSVQHPGGAGNASSGDRRFVEPLARAAVAVGLDALFLETHPDPASAPCDGACQIRTEELDRFVSDVWAIDQTLRSLR